MHLWHPDQKTYDGNDEWRCLEKEQKGSKVVTCYMAAFMDNMENSKVLTILLNAQLGNASIGKENHANRILPYESI